MASNRNNRILIVDDSEETISVFSNILRDKDYDITFAMDGPEALSMLKEHDYELVLLDILMPGMDGFAVFEEMKKNEKTAYLPVIFISQLDDTENIVKGFKMGGRDFIPKNTPPEVLLARVETHLKLYRTSLIVNNEVLKVNETLSRVYEKSKALNEELTTVNELKKDFLNFAAEDILNYLATIQGYTEYIKMKCEVDDPLRKKIDKIVKSSEKINKKLNEIRDKAARESGKRKLEESLVDIGELAREVVERQREYSRWKRIHIEDSIENGCVVYGDRMVLEEIIDNLVSNAIKFSPPDKTIWVRISKAGNLVKIEVKDEGPGFTKEDKVNLYKKYRPLSARPTGGELSIGIGLYITKDYVELHNGTIKLESVHGSGALFTVELPLNRTN